MYRSPRKYNYNEQIKESYEIPNSLKYAQMQCDGEKAYIDEKTDWYCGLGEDGQLIYEKQYGAVDAKPTNVDYANNQCKSGNSYILTDNNGDLKNFYMCGKHIEPGKPATYKDKYYPYNITLDICDNKVNQTAEDKYNCGFIEKGNKLYDFKTLPAKYKTALDYANSQCSNKQANKTSIGWRCGLAETGAQLDKYGDNDFKEEDAKSQCEERNVYKNSSNKWVCGSPSTLKEYIDVTCKLGDTAGKGYRDTSSAFHCGLQTTGNQIYKFKTDDLKAYFG